MKRRLPAIIRSWLLSAIVAVALFESDRDCQADPYQKPKPTESEWEELLVYWKLPRADQLPTLRSLPAGKKARWIELMRGYDPAERWNAGQPYNWGELDWRQLLALNDVETANWLTRQYQETRDLLSGQSMLWILCDWHSPEGIAFVARQTLSDELYKGLPGDVVCGPSSFEATYALFQKMLPKVVDLPWNVREWARGLEKANVEAYRKIARGGVESKASSDEASHYVTYREREIAQLWWRANEKAILEGRWQEVRPGETFDTPKYRTLLAQFGVPPPGAASNTKGDRLSAAVVKKTRPTASSRNDYLWIAVVALAAVLAGIAGWLVLRSRRGTG